MKKLFLKIIIYSVLILLVLESIIRIFHLTKDYPMRYVDQYGVEKWVPDQDGYSVTGIRRQNFSEYHINDFGYNSYREFKPTKDRVEIALVGDSFIEGFHQNYYNSTGKKIENKLPGVAVYEYGYAGYDLADELHLIKQYKSQFDWIDYVFIGLDFNTDLSRGKYQIVQDRLRLESATYKAMRQIKLLVYLQTIGAFDAPKEFVEKIFSNDTNSNKNRSTAEEANLKETLNSKRLENFKSLIANYGFDTSRFIFLLDSEKTPSSFLDYLDKNHYHYVDFGKKINHSKLPTTLIYDQHWNNYGRTLVAELIINYIKAIQH